ncbi:MAG: hypothetical protein KJ718_02540 [Nanoarchaeota archaeon]|nr:hypothetical protein [Nanoarchaeota archaeon]
MKKNIILLAVLILALVSLFMFSSWTNSMIVEEGEMSAGLNLLANASPLMMGIFIIIGLALFILISVKP